MFENHCDEINIGKSNLLQLQKWNKDKGPLKNLKPINLLNTSRKILSITTLNRIQRKLEQYLSAPKLHIDWNDQQAKLYGHIDLLLAKYNYIKI